MQKNYKKRILVVDDDIAACSRISAYLTGKEFLVDTAYDGLAALEAVKNMPDLVIMDVAMPKMDGLKVLERLKSEPLYAALPVIMLTRKTRLKYLSRGISLNADFYLPKPIKLDSLMEFINLALKDGFGCIREGRAPKYGGI